MTQLAKADATIYPDLRRRALQMRRADLPSDALRAVVMDWRIDTGIVTVLAAADGTASVYLSNGGGFVGGGQANSKLHEAAMVAVRVAQRVVPKTVPSSDPVLPEAGQVCFHFVTGLGTLTAVESEKKLHEGASALAPLGSAMQEIVTLYRIDSEVRKQQQDSPPLRPKPTGDTSVASQPRITPAFWGKQDHFGRGVQAACGVALLLAAAFLFYDANSRVNSYGADAGAITCLILGVRCLWYACTGKDNVNLDDL